MEVEQREANIYKKTQPRLSEGDVLVIFNKLDKNKLGYLNTKNLNLRDLTSTELKLIKELIGLIYSNSKKRYYPKDFIEIWYKKQIFE